MKFNINEPLLGLKELKTKIWDAHVHIWDADAFKDLERWGAKYGVSRFMGITAPDIKSALEKNGKGSQIEFAMYLPMDAFAKQDPEKLLSAVDEAHTHNYKMCKMWFGPRFLDYFQAEKKFSISDPIFEPVFSRIEDYSIPIDVHVADPDYWYETIYLDKNLYRTKNQAIQEFTSVLRRHPALRAISIHFGSLPEDLDKLSTILKQFPNLFIDTASTKWMIREIGKNIEKSRQFLKEFQKRIVFATDLSVGWENRDEHYFASRYWAQRLFWESKTREIELPFEDSDNPNPPTVINGLNLPKAFLEDFYWNNMARFLS
ncbi:MAG: amidohydrolase family protein [Candidatus Hodarchaeales archaeon]